ncbi:zeta-crystallin [Periconia macrospinosa]|uniref:Zeta-crystallin n=1 Tax=Periconia macrospinosa TaxID=97972 RepID=A0A2V1DIE3_9PLEO|nr:zeta-crystallin [Periconia macrospinosa]
MKAILIKQFVSDLADLQVSDIAPPKQDKSKIQVQITHAAVTHVDQLYAQGLHQNNKRHIKPPFILGNEFSGIVTESNPLSPFKPGDRVFGGALGAYAEHANVSADTLRTVPQAWSNLQACAVGSSGAISYGALISVAGLRRGECVLILGASGGLGVMAIQIAKAVGARVIAVVGGEDKADMVRKIGADEVVSYRDVDWEESVRGKTAGGDGVEVVYDAVDQLTERVGMVRSALKCIKYRGRIVIVGFAAREGKMEQVAMNRVLLKGAAIYGYRFGEDGRRDPRRVVDAWEGFMRLVDCGKVGPVVYERSYDGLGEVARALLDVREHKTWGRAVVKVRSEGEQSKVKL